MRLRTLMEPMRKQLQASVGLLRTGYIWALYWYSFQFIFQFLRSGVPRNPFRSISVANEMEYGELSV